MDFRDVRMKERISQISVSSRKNLSPGFHALSTRVYLPRNRYAISTLAVHFHHCRMFAEYRRVRRAAICFIHFSHSKFITFRKTDSFIPCVQKLFSATVLDINDYGKSPIDSRAKFRGHRLGRPLRRSSAKREIKCYLSRRLGVSTLLLLEEETARPDYLGIVKQSAA